MSTFEEWQPTLHPTGLAGPWGRAWAVALGRHKDGALALAKEAVRARFLPDAPTDALARIGADRDLGRVESESDTSFRARLAGAWESWSWLGTRYGITYAVGLLGYGYPTVWSYRELPPDTNAARWARVLVYFRGLPAWDAGATWDGESTWDSERTEDSIETADPLVALPRLRRVIRHWINARDVCDRVVVAFGSLLWDVDSVWDDEGTWDAGDGETVWQSPDWDTSETGVEWDSPVLAWDAFC